MTNISTSAQDLVRADWSNSPAVGQGRPALPKYHVQHTDPRDVREPLTGDSRSPVIFFLRFLCDSATIVCNPMHTLNRTIYRFLRRASNFSARAANRRALVSSGTRNVGFSIFFARSPSW